MADDLSINQKVANFITGQLNKAVGDGGCWALAENALLAAGAMTSNDLTDKEEFKKADAQYVFGTAIEAKNAAPGDLVQFKNYVMTRTVETKYDLPDGNSITLTSTDEVPKIHHSAVVMSMMDKDGRLVVVEQWKGSKAHWGDFYTRPLAVESSGTVPLSVIASRLPRDNDYNVRMKMLAEAKKVSNIAAYKETATISLSKDSFYQVYHPKPK